jgi:hypothetical protein
MQFHVRAAAKDKDSAFTAIIVPDLRTISQAIRLAIFSTAFAIVTKHALLTSLRVSKELAKALNSHVYTLVQVIRNSTDGPPSGCAHPRSLVGMPGCMDHQTPIRNSLCCSKHLD